MIRFFLSIVAATIIIVAFLLWAQNTGMIGRLPSFFKEILILLGLTTVLIFKYLYRPREPAFFVQLYLGTMVIKLLAYGGFCLWIIVKDKPGSTSNITFFLVVYLLFTVLEISFLFKRISRSK
jgi:hypothetical protein